MANDILTTITAEVQNAEDINTLEALEDEVIDRMARARGSFKKAWAGVLGTIRGRMKRLDNWDMEDWKVKMAKLKKNPSGHTIKVPTDTLKLRVVELWRGITKVPASEYERRMNNYFIQLEENTGRRIPPTVKTVDKWEKWYDRLSKKQKDDIRKKYIIKKVNPRGKKHTKKNPTQGNRYIFTFAPHKNNKRRLRWIRYGKSMESALAAAKRAARADYPNAHGFSITRDDTKKNPKHKVTYRTKAGYERTRYAEEPKHTRKAKAVTFYSKTGSGRKSKAISRKGFQGQVKKIHTKQFKGSITRLNKEVSVHVPTVGTVTHRYKTDAAAKSAYKAISSASAAMRFMARYI